MRRSLIAAVVTVMGLAFMSSAPAQAVAVAADTPTTTDPSLAYVPTPYVPPQVEQFAYLGYKVPRAAVLGTPSKKAASEVKRFQAKFGLPQTGKVDKRTVKALEKYAGGAELPKRCREGGEFLICVNKFNRTLWAVNPDGSIAQVMDSRFGMPGYETREGKFKVFRKGGANHISTLYRVEMPYPLFFSGGQAVHYSHEFARLPNSRSHGCVGTRDYAAQKWLWERSPIGTPVIVLNRAPNPS